MDLRDTALEISVTSIPDNPLFNCMEDACVCANTPCVVAKVNRKWGEK